METSKVLIHSFLPNASFLPGPSRNSSPLASFLLAVLTKATFLSAASGHTDSLHLLIDSGERADITDVMDAYGQ